MNFKLKQLLQQLEERLPDYTLTAPYVSQSSLGWQIEHTLLTFNLILKQLQRSNPNDYRWKLNWNRILIFTLGFIPRGKAKAPKVVQPQHEITLEGLQQHLQEAYRLLEHVHLLDSDAYFEHPFFGALDKKSTLYFLKLHTQHHLKIIKDIAKEH
jgi:hypothetical protein